MDQVSSSWWEEDLTDGEREHRVRNWLGRVLRDEPQRYRAHERVLRIWGRTNADVASSMSLPDYQAAKDVPAWNVVRNVVEALHADLLTNRPRIAVIPRAEDTETRWSLLRAARRAENWLDGWWDASAVQGVMSEIALDGLLFDGSAVVVHEDGVLERVPPWHLHVDPVEGGTPKTWCVTRWIPVWEAKDRWGDDVRTDGKTPGWSANVAWPRAEESVLVAELWHSGAWRMVLVGEEIVESEPWRNDAPVVTWRWQHPLVGWWSDSPAYQLVGLQWELQQDREAIARAHRLLGRSKLLWPEECGAPSSQWDSETASIIRVKNTRGGIPTVLTPQSVAPEMYRWVDVLRASAYEMVGASQISATASLPASISGSGKSIEVYEDATSRRHLPQQRAWEQAHVEIARKALALAKGSTTVRTIGDRRVTIDATSFRDVLDQYDCATYPVAFLSRSPSGRLRDLERWIAFGWVTREEAMRLAEIPSTSSYATLQTTMLDAVTADAEALLDGEKKYPDEYYDLELILRVMPRVYRRAAMDGAPQQILDAIDAYIQQARAMLPAPAPQAPTAQDMNAMRQIAMGGS
jgi:hypothetical protein